MEKTGFEVICGAATTPAVKEWVKAKTEGCSVNIYVTGEPFLLRRTPRDAAMLVCSLPLNSTKRWALDAMDTCVTHASLVHDVTETNC